MYVGFGVVGHVVVDDMADARHVEAARGDVGGDHDVDGAGLEAFDHLLAQALGQVAVERRDGITARLQLVGKFDGGGLGAHEDQCGVEVVLDFEDARQRFELLPGVGLAVGLAGGNDGRGGGADLDFLRLAQVLARHAADHIRHGGREQRGLARRRRVFEDPLDVVDEAHAQHFVGFVQHQHRQVVEHQALALEVVHDAAGGADDDVGTARKSAQLHHHALSAVDRQDVEAGQVVGVLLQRLGDLDRQFARRRQDQGLRHGALEVDLLQQRQGEGGGFAGAGLGFAEQVVAGQQDRDAGGLDRRGGFVADIGEGLEQRLGKPEGIEPGGNSVWGGGHGVPAQGRGFRGKGRSRVADAAGEPRIMPESGKNSP